MSSLLLFILPRLEVLLCVVYSSRMSEYHVLTVFIMVFCSVLRTVVVLVGIVLS